MPKITRREYPQLDRLLWDIHAKTIDPKVAFGIYEQRWAFVAKNILTAKEKTLIKKLTAKYGNGIFMPRNAA